MGGSQNIVSSSAPAAASIRVSTSTYGRALPRVYGKGRVAVNCIGYDDFKSIEHKTTQDAGGKGGSTTMTNISYTYTVALQMAVCSGVVSSIPRLWVGKAKGSLADFDFSFYPGDNTQTAFGYTVTNHPEKALTYRGTCYIASGLFDLGGDSSLPQVTAEVEGPLSGLNAGSVTTGDTNPAPIIYDLLTAKDAAGIPPSKVGSLIAMQTFCQAAKILISPVYTEQEAASDAIKRILQIANTGVTYSEGVLKFVPLADSNISDNGASYTAITSAVYDLTDDDYLDGGDSPVKCDRVSTADAYNHIQVQFLDRNNDYADAIAESKDQASIEQTGLRTLDPINLKEICEPSVAAVVADHIKQRSVYMRNTYEFKLGWRFALLEALDIVTLTDSGLGLDKMPVRILDIEEDEDGGLSVRAEELPGLTLTGTRYPAPVATSGGIDFNAAPGNANTPVIFEPPIALSGAPEAWIATSGGADWGGCDVWISTDNATYARVGRISGNSRHGVLSAVLPVGSALDTANTLAVNLTVSKSVLAPGTTQNATDLVTLCYVGGELLAYRDATLTGLNQYNLGYLVRGAYGTPITSHASASKFIRLDGGVFKYAYSPDMIGRTIYVKLQSFNQFQGGIQDLGSISPTSYVLSGAVVSNVAGLALEQPFVGTSAAIKWNRTPGALGYTVEVWSTVLERTVVLGDVTRYEYSWEEAKADGGPWRDLTFKVKANSANGVSSTQAQLVVNNPVPAALTGLSVTGGWESLFFKCTKPTDQDFNNILIYISTTSGFTPDANSLVYQGPANTVTIDRLNNGTLLVGGTNYYLRAAASDLFGSTGLNMSSELTAQPLSAAGAIKPGDIVSEMLSDLAVPEKFGASKMTQIQLHGSGYNNPSGVYLRLNGIQHDFAGRGLTVWVLNKTSHAIESTTVYDVYSGGAAFAAMASALNALSSAKIVCIASDDAINFDADLRVALKRCGASPAIDSVTYAGRFPYALIGFPGIGEGNGVEMLKSVNPTDPPADVGAWLMDDQLIGSGSGVSANTLYSVNNRVGNVETNLSSNYMSAATTNYAIAASFNSVSARLDSGDVHTAIVSAQSTATASQNSINAKYTLKVQAGNFVAGVALAADAGGGESAMVLLADKFAFASPTAGVGSPYYYPFVMGTVNGVAQAGINGNLVVDGSIYARHISVTTLAAISANIGTVTAGKVQNAAGTNYMDLNASGASYFINTPNFKVTAAGAVTIAGTLAAGSVFADNLITTKSVIPQAITVTTGVKTSTGYSLATATETQLLSKTLDFVDADSGSAVGVFVTVQTTINVGGPTNIEIKTYRNGSLINSSNFVPINGYYYIQDIDYPGAGTHTYTVKAKFSGSGSLSTLSQSVLLIAGKR